VEIAGHNYIDGGISEYLGIETLKEQDGNVFAVGAHLGSVSGRYRNPRHILHLIMQLANIMAKKNYAVSEQAADFLIRPYLDDFSSFDFHRTSELINIGYQEAKASLPQLQREWDKRSAIRARRGMELNDL
jgi:predicted acylesterase/phospholipase RssA